MSRQPTQVEENPKRPLIPMKDVDIYVRSGDPPATINLNDIGYYDDVSHYDIGDSDDEMCRYHEVDDCMICGQRVEHSTPFCPYKKFVPHNVSLPPGIQRICTCCGKWDGHPGDDWEGCAIPKECLDCGTYGKHWTGDADCPTKAPKHQHHEKPDSYQLSGRPLMSPQAWFGYVLLL